MVRVPAVRADEGERSPELPVQPIGRSLSADVTPPCPGASRGPRGGSVTEPSAHGAPRAARGRRDARSAGRPDHGSATATRRLA